MNALSDQTIALAGLVQACQLVDEIAQTGQCDQHALETSISSLFETNPSSTEAVFGSVEAVSSGLRALTKVLGKDEQSKQANWVRYLLSVMHLESKLRKDKAMLNEIGKGLQQAESPKAHFGLLHENTFASLANTYQKTISTFQVRIQVNGDPNILKAELNAAKIRTLLLAAMRSAMLWRQVGGHRWHLLFKRKAIVDQAEQLLR